MGQAQITIGCEEFYKLQLLDMVARGLGNGVCPHLCMPLAMRWGLQEKRWRRKTMYRVLTQKKETRAKDTRERTSSARGNGGPDVYDVSKSLRRDNDLRFRFAWQGHG